MRLFLAEHTGHQLLRSSYLPIFFLSHGASVSQASSWGSQAKQTLSGWPVEPALGVRAYRSASKGAIKTKLKQTPWLYSIILYNTDKDRKMEVLEFHWHTDTDLPHITVNLKRHPTISWANADWREGRLWNYNKIFENEKKGKAVLFTFLHCIWFLTSYRYIHAGLIQWEPTLTICEMFKEFPFLWGNYFYKNGALHVH